MKKPYKLAPPSLVADFCALYAWNDDLDDNVRLVLEQAADTIRLLMKRSARSGGRAERFEAEVQRLENYVRHLAGQKGGAA